MLSRVLARTRPLRVRGNPKLLKSMQPLSRRNLTSCWRCAARSTSVRLQTGVDVVVTTPGRLLDLIEQGFVDLAAVDVLIPDAHDNFLRLSNQSLQERSATERYVTSIAGDEKQECHDE